MRKFGKVLRPGHDKDGYERVVLVSAGERREWRVHALVLRAFVGPKPVDMESCHNDGNKSNNALSNLRYDTQSGNYADRHKHGTASTGVSNGRCKLTEQEVRRIRAMRGVVSTVELGKKYRIVSSVVSAIQRREIWRSIE